MSPHVRKTIAEPRPVPDWHEDYLNESLRRFLCLFVTTSDSHVKFTTLFFNERLGSRCAVEVCPGVVVERSTSQACQASRLLPSVANVRRRGRQSNDCPVLDGGGSLDVLSTQSGMRSNSGVLCNGCLAKKGPEQSSDTAAHQSRCHSLFVGRVVQ